MRNIIAGFAVVSGLCLGTLLGGKSLPAANFLFCAHHSSVFVPSYSSFLSSTLSSSTTFSSSSFCSSSSSFFLLPPVSFLLLLDLCPLPSSPSPPSFFCVSLFFFSSFMVRLRRVVVLRWGFFQRSVLQAYVVLAGRSVCGRLCRLEMSQK